MSDIHSSAIIHTSARIAEDVTIGPYCVIGADVVIEQGTRVGPHVVINGPTTIGRNNRIFQFASLGEEPQDYSYKGEPTRLEIGDNNIIREYVTINRGTMKGGGVTSVRDHNLIMAYVHFGHDCHIGSNNTFSNGVQLGGHVEIGNNVNLAGMALIHQSVRVGSYSFCGMGCGVSKDVPPYVMVARNPARVFGLNSVGLKRKGFDAETIKQIKRAYKLLYSSGLKLDEAIEAISELGKSEEKVADFVDFIRQSKRSIIR